ncbi:MAG TPA: TIGR04563 family protein [Polyangia bacterium]|nr:TIGR04563 family protein [Polyangia bacterium]
MTGSNKRKQSLYFPEEMLTEIGNEAMRQDRSMSWIVQKCWQVARKDMMRMPSVNDLSSADTETEGESYK